MSISDKKSFIITIDGPAGAGKSTVAGNLARKLGFFHLNSGALYRASALIVQDFLGSLENEKQVEEVVQKLNFEFLNKETGEFSLLVNGKDFCQELQSPRASELSSKIAVFPNVRAFLSEVQRQVGEKQSLVVEGRDSGTVVFPNASAKFYLDASREIRAKRRADTEKQSIEEVLRQSDERDERDQSRAVAPLRKAEDTITIDTSHLSVDEVVARIFAELRKKKGIIINPNRK